MTLSKTDARQVQNIATHLRLGNVRSAALGASSFVRSSTSDLVDRKRRAALADIGIIVAPVPVPVAEDITFSLRGA